MEYGLQRRIRVILDGVGILRPLGCSSCFLFFFSFLCFLSLLLTVDTAWNGLWSDLVYYIKRTLGFGFIYDLLLDPWA
jgi:hypothetical protein